MWEIISLIKMITLRGEGYEKEGQVVPERMEQYHASKKKKTKIS